VKILAKFNLILIVLFGAGMYVVARMAYGFLEQNARAEVLHQAQMMVELVLH
jgi:protein-histidine pros-kinase